MPSTEEQLRDLQLEFEKIKLQSARSESHYDSEHGTIARRLDRMVIAIKELDTKLADKIDEVDDKYDIIVNGDGNGRLGLRIKIDRIQQTNKLLWMIVTPIAIAVISTIVIYYTTKPG